MDAKEKIDIFNHTRDTVGQDEEGSGMEEGLKEVDSERDLDETIDYVDFRNVVFHSPTQPRAARTSINVSKPDY